MKQKCKEYCKCLICGNIVMIKKVTTYCDFCGAKIVKNKGKQLRDWFLQGMKEGGVK